MAECQDFCDLMFAKKARHQISLESPDESFDAYGAFTRTWTELASMNAIIQPLRQNEVVSYGGIDSKVSHKITTRYQALFANPLQVAKYRIIFKTRIFTIIQAIDLYEANEYVEIIAQEVENDG